MFIQFKDINGSEIIIRADAIWGITIPAVEAPAEILLVNAEKSIKVIKEVAQEISKVSPFDA